MIIPCLSFLLALGPLVHANEYYHFVSHENVCFFFTKGSSVMIGLDYGFPLRDGSTAPEIEITFFDATLAHFEHSSSELPEHNASMNKPIAMYGDGWDVDRPIIMDNDDWSVEVDTTAYEPEVFTLLPGDRHNLQNITRTGKYCYLTQYTGAARDGAPAFWSQLFINDINSSLPGRHIINIIKFIALTLYSLIVSLIVWYWSLPRIIFWRELASFFFCLIVLVQRVRDGDSIVTEAMQSCFSVSLLALYFKPDNIVTPLILGLSLLQAILFVEEKYPHVCMVDTVIFVLFLTVNFLFVKKAWDKRSRLGVLVQLERLWILLERFFVPHTFGGLMRFLSQSSFYKKYVLYDETFSVNGFSIEYQTYSVLLKLLVIGGGLYCAKPLGSSHTRRNKRASNGQVLLMFGLCAASVFLLAGIIFPVLRRHHCVSYHTFSPDGYLDADFFVPLTGPLEGGFIYARPTKERYI
jgi:hypothetical protein